MPLPPSPLQLPPTIIPFPAARSNGDARTILSIDFIDYDGVFSAIQCTAAHLPFIVIETVEVDDGWRPSLIISPEATFEPIQWPLAIQQGATVTLILSTPSERRARPERIVLKTTNGEKRFLRLDLWEAVATPAPPTP